MAKTLATLESSGEILEQVIIAGDLAKLSSKDRVSYYKQVCESIGLNPMTKPFDYINLNGKLTLYARRDCADQLRAIHGVSIKVISQTVDDGLFTVHVAAQDKTGRGDEDIGTVQIAGLRGEAKANAMLKAMTKAKRRVTLSICGLGFLDETEISDIKDAGSPTQTLDELFPGSAGRQSEIPTRREPQTGEETAQTPEVPETPAPSPAAAIALVGGIVLKVGAETYNLADSITFYVEYRKQLKLVSDNGEVPSRERMTLLREFEELNMAGLDTIPAEGKKKLVGLRKQMNRRLGAQAKKE